MKITVKTGIAVLCALLLSPDIKAQKEAWKQDMTKDGKVLVSYNFLEKIEDMIPLEWFQDAGPQEVDALAEWHESLEGREEIHQGCYAEFEGKRWFVMNAQTCHEAFHFVAQKIILANPDPLDWAGILTEMHDAYGGPMSYLARELDIIPGALWNIKRGLYAPNDTIRPKLLEKARELGVIKEAA